LNQDLAQKFFAQVKRQAAGQRSDEHFTVDGTLIEAWAGQKSFRRKDEDGGSGSGGDFHGEPRRNRTHASSTAPEARLYKKSAGQEAKLSYLGHTLVENRNGLITAAMTTPADGRAERDAALLMLHELTRKRSGRITTGADTMTRAISLSDAQAYQWSFYASKLRSAAEKSGRGLRRIRRAACCRRP
jgi:hypothetical protein